MRHWWSRGFESYHLQSTGYKHTNFPVSNRRQLKRGSEAVRARNVKRVCNTRAKPETPKDPKPLFI